MELSLKPETMQFIDEQIESGHFPSCEAVIEAAIEELREAKSFALDDETIAAINEGLDEGDRGEGIDLDTFRSRFFNHPNEKTDTSSTDIN